MNQILRRRGVLACRRLAFVKTRQAICIDMEKPISQFAQRAQRIGHLGIAKSNFQNDVGSKSLKRAYAARYDLVLGFLGIDLHKIHMRNTDLFNQRIERHGFDRDRLRVKIIEPFARQKTVP
jgi:hypothetical protein